MAAPIVDLCEAVAAHIKSQTYSFSFNTTRTNFERSDLRDTAATNVFVYPGQPLGSATSVYDRGRFTRRYTVAVHITNFIDDQNRNKEIDDALLLVHEIEKSLENVNFGEMQMMAFETETSARPFFEMDQVQERSFFHVILSVEYEGVV